MRRRAHDGRQARFERKRVGRNPACSGDSVQSRTLA